MRRAVYVRVSTQRQAHLQTIEQQLERLQTHFQEQGWEWGDDLVFRDDGYSGASLKRASAGSLTGASGSSTPGSGRDHDPRPTSPQRYPSNALDLRNWKRAAAKSSLSSDP